MGKSIGCVRNDLNGLHFLTGHQKVILHPKARIDCACASHGLLEKPEGYLLGEFARYLFFCIRIRVGAGDDQCLFNVAAGMETWIMGSRAITLYLALWLVGLKAQQFLCLGNLRFRLGCNAWGKCFWQPFPMSITGLVNTEIMVKYIKTRPEEQIIPIHDY